MSGNPGKDSQLKSHFERLMGMKNPGATLAKAYVERSRQIGRDLVQHGVAARAEDVNGVLVSGFYHLYGPINDFCK